MPHLSEVLQQPTKGSSGHVYVVKYSNGDVKVGRTQDTRGRMRSLRDHRFYTGVHLVDGWCSEEHAKWRLNELRLLVFCRERFGEPVLGSETFAAEYETTLAYAQSIAADAA